MLTNSSCFDSFFLVVFGFADSLMFLTSNDEKLYNFNYSVKFMVLIDYVLMLTCFSLREPLMRPYNRDKY